MSKHLLLTGGAGFIGHHTVEHVLRNTDWTITIVDRLNYAGSQNHLTDMEIWEKEGRRVKFVFHDFRAQFLDITLAMATSPRPDYIVHMGAETHVDNSILDPRIFVETNVIGTLNMLELCRVIEPEKFIYVSTDEVYGPVKMSDGMTSVTNALGKEAVSKTEKVLHLHREGEPHRPSNPYSASKSGAEALCYAYWNTYNLPIMVTNTMNNFGERQHPEKFIPKTVRAILKGEPVIIHVKKNADGNVIDISSRCWLHARNHADGLVFLLEHVAGFGQSYNIVGEWAHVGAMANKIGDILGMGYQAQVEDFHSFRPGHDMHYGLDGGKMEALGWTPPVSLDQSLQNTIEWMQQHPSWLQM